MKRKHKSADGNFEGAPGGRRYVNYRILPDRPDAFNSNTGDFFMDTARLQGDSGPS